MVKRDWLDAWRLPAAPRRAVMTVVGAGAPRTRAAATPAAWSSASLTAEGVVALITDQSAPMTSDQWAVAAVDLAVQVRASEIVVESFGAREGYRRVIGDALRRRTLGRAVKVTPWPPKGSGRGGGDAVARSSALLQALEVGTVRLAGHLPSFEEQAVTWQSGQHCPDAMAALVVAHDVLAHAAGRQVALSSPVDAAERAAPPPDWMRRSVGEPARRGAVVVSLGRGRGGAERHTGYDPLRGSVAAEVQRAPLSRGGGLERFRRAFVVVAARVPNHWAALASQCRVAGNRPLQQSTIVCNAGTCQRRWRATNGPGRNGVGGGCRRVGDRRGGLRRTRDVSAVAKNTIAADPTSQPIRLTTWPPKGSGRGGGDALARSAALRAGLGDRHRPHRRAHLPDLLSRRRSPGRPQRAGQHPPASLAALVVAHDVFVYMIGQQWGFASPLDTERRAGRARYVATGVDGPAASAADRSAAGSGRQFLGRTRQLR